MKGRAAAFGLLLASTPLVAQPAKAGPVNDLLVDFGSRGLWVFLNNSLWQQLDTGDPSSLAACDDGTIYAGFPGRGLLRRTVAASSWETVRADLVPHRMATGDTDGNDVCDIGAIIWSQTPRPSPRWIGKLLMGLNHASGWITVNNNPEILTDIAFGNFDGSPNDDITGTAIDDDSIGIGHGLRIGYNNLRFGYSAWGPAGYVATGDIDGDGLDEIVVAGGARLYAYYDTAPTPWPGIPQTLLGTDVQDVVVGDLDADPRDDILYGSFGDGVGVIYNNSGFPGVLLDSRRPAQIAIADLDNDGTGDAIASFWVPGFHYPGDFGQGVSVRYGPGGFQLLRGWRVAALVPCACD